MKKILFKNIEKYIANELKIDKQDLKYKLLKSKIFSLPIFENYKFDLYRTTDGIELSFENSKYEINFKKPIINDFQKEIYSNIKKILLNNQSYKISKIEINEYLSTIDENLKKNLIENNEIFGLFTSRNPVTPFIGIKEENLLYSFNTYGREDINKDILSSYYEIFLKESRLYYKKNKNIDQENSEDQLNEYSKFINNIINNVSENNLLKISYKSKNIQHIQEILFENFFPKIKEKIVNNINSLIILKTKEELYKSNQIEEYYDKILEKFPEIKEPLFIKTNENKIEVNKFKLTIENEQADFIKNEVNNLNYSNILTKKEFNKKHSISKFENLLNIPNFIDEKIYLEQFNNTEYNYRLVLNYDKKENVAYPAFMFINSSLEIYEESINHLMKYLSKNKIELCNINNPESFSFETQLNYYFDDFDSYVYSYNESNKDEPFIYWDEANIELKKLLNSMNINDYETIKSIYLKFNNHNYEEFNSTDIINFLNEMKTENKKNIKFDI